MPLRNFGLSFSRGRIRRRAAPRRNRPTLGTLVPRPTYRDRSVSRARAEYYRRQARECLDVARTLSLEPARATLIDMPRTWLRLAREQESIIPPHGKDESAG
jgi:hypothetical protein